MMQGIFAAQAAASDTPSQTIARVNLALYKRGIESRFVTLMYGSLEPDGRLTYCNAGHNPPLVVGTGGVRRLEVGGPIVGLFEARDVRGGDRHAGARRRAARVQRRRVGGAVGEGEEYGEERILATADTAIPARRRTTCCRRSSPTCACSRRGRRRATTSRRWCFATAFRLRRA